jgi:hypothetical protein
MIQEASIYLTDDRAASAYVARRFRDLQALQQDLADPDNVYVKLTRTESGVQIKTRKETLLALSYTGAQAYILARFW